MFGSDLNYLVLLVWTSPRLFEEGQRGPFYMDALHYTSEKVRFQTEKNPGARE